MIAAIPTLSPVQAQIEQLHGQALAETARLTRDRDEVERLLARLRGGGTYMSKDTQDFLADMNRMGIPAQTLSEVADIAPAFAQWRGIIESILGDWVDAVIVEPAFMDRAYGHFDKSYKAMRQEKPRVCEIRNNIAQD